MSKIEVKTREFNFYTAPDATVPGYVAFVHDKEVGRFKSAKDAAYAAAHADYAANGGRRGGAFVTWRGGAGPRPAGAIMPDRFVRVCYRVRPDRD